MWFNSTVHGAPYQSPLRPVVSANALSWEGRAKALHGCRQFVSRDVALSCLTNATHEVRGDGYGGSYLAAGRLT